MATKRIPLIAFAIPIVWLALLGLAELLRYTEWGREGHPSNSLILFIYLLLGAPLVGLVGLIPAWRRRKDYSDRMCVAAILVNAGVIATGIWFWVFVWVT